MLSLLIWYTKFKSVLSMLELACYDLHIIHCSKSDCRANFEVCQKCFTLSWRDQTEPKKLTGTSLILAIRCITMGSVTAGQKQVHNCASKSYTIASGLALTLYFQIAWKKRLCLSSYRTLSPIHMPCLTHWGRDKIAEIFCRRLFKCLFIEWKCLNID